MRTDPVQVVVLAAGYDTRCYRLKTGNTQVSSCVSIKSQIASPLAVKDDIKFHEQIRAGYGVLASLCLQGRHEHCPSTRP